MRTCVRFLLLWVILVGVGFPLSARERLPELRPLPQRIFFGPLAGYFTPGGSDLKSFYGTGGLCGGGSLGIRVWEGLQIWGDARFYQRSGFSDDLHDPIRLTLLPLTASLRYEFLRGRTLSPFVGGGVVQMKVEEVCDGTKERFWVRGFAMDLGAGIRFVPNGRVELMLRYMDVSGKEGEEKAFLGGLCATLGLQLIL